MAKDIVSGDKELIAKLQKMRDAVDDNLGSVAVAGGLVIANAAKNNLKSNKMRKTSNLSRSIHVGSHPGKSPDFAGGQEYSDIGGAVESKGHASVNVGTNLEYAAIHEFGGTIQPQKGKYLAIPVGTYKGSPLDHPDLVTVQKGGGDPVMIDSEGRVQYVFKKSVEIPANPYLRPALDENKDEVQLTMARALGEIILKIARE